ncbi:hypothetical protein ACWZJV_25500 [Nocardioides sp. WG-D5]
MPAAATFVERDGEVLLIHRVEYDNGEVRQQFAVVYRATYVTGNRP